MPAPTYSGESADLPLLFVVRPTYNAAQAIVAAPVQINYVNRVTNMSDAADVVVRETKSANFDLIGAGYGTKIVNVPGVGNITYLQVASALKKIADAERLLLA